MRVPTNPNYVFEQPKVRGQYVNPVTVSNYLITLANEYHDVVEGLSKINRRQASLKADLSKAESELDEFEQELLLTHPAPAGDRKSNKLLEVYIRKLVLEDSDPQTKATWTKLRTTVRELRADVVTLDLERDVYFARMGQLKVQSENIKTHLSFVKSEGRIHG